MAYCSKKEAYDKSIGELLYEDQYYEMVGGPINESDRRSMLNGMNQAFRLGAAAMKKAMEKEMKKNDK